MAVSKKLIEGVLARTALLFEHHQYAREYFADTVECWAALMVDLTDEQFSAAARHLALTLRRFPVPADFIEAARPAQQVAEQMFNRPVLMLEQKQEAQFVIGMNADGSYEAQLYRWGQRTFFAAGSNEDALMRSVAQALEHVRAFQKPAEQGA